MLDAHQHFWHYHPVRDAWISDDMAILRHDYLPAQLQPVLLANGINSCIAVQADQSETETHFLLDLAAQHDFIKGVVGWVDLCAENVEARLEYWAQFPKLRGFRHILQGEQPEFMLQKSFLNGLRALQKFNFTYDILVYPTHLDAVKTVLREVPDQAFILDHLAKPYIKNGLIDQWAKDIQILAQHENLYCKVSGLVTEADWGNWKIADFRPYLNIVFKAFGEERVVYGSDWPVCLLAGSYSDQFSILKEYGDARFWGENGAAFYGVDL